MLQIRCPNCGAEISFRAGETVYAVCEYCSTGVVRNDVTVESIGKVAVLQDTWSPLQIGTEGDVAGGHFFIVGKVVFEYDAGNWSEWFLAFNDGRTGWMTEAQGHYAVSFESEKDARTVEELGLEHLTLGKSLPIAGDNFSVSDIKEVNVIFAKGELPFKATPGRESTVIDFVAQHVSAHRTKSDENSLVKFASCEFSEDGVSFFTGGYYNFESLSLTNLRVIDGW